MMKKLFVLLAMISAMLVACSTQQPTPSADPEGSVETVRQAFSNAVTLDYGSVPNPGCGICGQPGGDYSCESWGVGWNGGIRTFSDPTPGGATVSTVVVTIFEVGCGASGVSVTLNGTALGTYASAGNCSCGTCDAPVTLTLTNGGGIPGYVKGGTNTLQINYDPRTGTPCVARAVVTLSDGGALTATTTTLASATNPSTYGQPVTFTAHVSGGATPTGTVTFRDGGAPIGTGTLNGAGDATFTTSALTAGSHTMDAVYGGDSSHATSTSAPLPQTVNKSNTTTALTSSQNPSVINGSVTFTATVAAVAPGAGTPTGTVTFSDGGTPLGTGTLDGTGRATFTTTALTVGMHSIVATYGSDGNFNGSTSSTLTQTVNLDGESITIASSLNPSTFNDSVTFTTTITSTSSGGTPTGTMTFKDGAATLGTAPIMAGVATFTTSTLSAGTHTITAVYGGDMTHVAGTSASIDQIVNKAATTVTLTSLVNPTTFGQPTTFTATVTSPAGTAPGNVTFKDGATTLATVALAGGTATFSTASLAVGNHDITAVYAGSPNFLGATSSVLVQSVGLAQTTTSLVSSTNPSLINMGVTFTAHVDVVAPGAGTPTTGAAGVQFKDGASVIGVAPLDGTGTAKFTTSTLSPGTHAITAVYPGDGSFDTSTSPQVSQVVNKDGSAVTLASSLNPSTYRVNVKFSATVTGTGSKPTGTVSFADGTTDLGTVTLDGTGLATLSTASLTVRAHTITATYNGDSSYAGGATGSVVQTVGPANTTTALSSSANPATTGDAITFTAQVSSTAAGATGSVEFFDGNVSLGKSNVADTADALVVQATISTSSLSIGGHAISAVYAGDATHAPSTSSTLTETVNDKSAAPDAGAPPPPHDAGVATPPGAAPSNGTTGGSGGCGCRTTSSSGAGAAAVLPLLGTLLLALRRRKRR